MSSEAEDGTQTHDSASDTIELRLMIQKPEMDSHGNEFSARSVILRSYSDRLTNESNNELNPFSDK